jgi:hypothetical protein
MPLPAVTLPFAVMMLVTVAPHSRAIAKSSVKNSLVIARNTVKILDNVMAFVVVSLCLRCFQIQFPFQLFLVRIQFPFQLFLVQ